MRGIANVWRVCRKSAIAAPNPNMARSTSSASWRCWIDRRGDATWTATLLARELGDIHEQYIWRFLRAQKIDLSGRKSWCESNDPEFASKAADIVVLYMMPPDNAVVLSVDEKPSIQALERAQGYLKLPNGRAMTGQSHDYKRHGTTALFAALEVATGKVAAATIGGAGASSFSTS